MKNAASNEKVSTEKESKQFGKEFPRDREQTDKQLQDLVEVIHFTEKGSAKIHRVLDEAEIYRTVKEEFAKSERYNASIFLLTEDGSKLRFAETSLSPRKIKLGEKIVGLQSYKSYVIDLNKSNFFIQVVKDGKTIEARFIDVVSELFPRPLALLVTKTIGYEKKSGILTPLKRHGKVIGVLVVDSVLLAEHFIPSVKNLAQHISTALELAEQHVERKKTEAALVESERRYRFLFANMNSGFAFCKIVSDNDGKPIDYIFLEVNDDFEKLTGLRKEAVLGKRVSEVFFSIEKDPTDWIGIYGRVATTGEPARFESYFEPLKKWFSIAAYRPEIGYFAMAFDDITDRKKAEESLRESEEKHRKTIVNANVGIIAYDPEGEVKVLNPKMEEMTGFNRTEIPTLVNWFEKLYPNEEERRKVRDKWFKRMSEEGEVKGGHAIITTKEGKHRNFLFNGVQLESGDSIAFAHDITEQKKAEEELRETKDYLDNLLDYANAPIIVWDKEERITLFNNAFESFAGHKKESMLGRNMDVLFPPLQKEEIMQTIEKATKGEKWKSVEIPILCKDKETKIALWNSANITDKEGKTVATIAQGQDITKRKMAEDALRKSENESRTLLENLPQKIFFKNRKSVYIAANENYARDLKIKFDEIAGRTDYDFFPKKLAEKYRADDKRIMESGKTEDVEEEYIQDGQKVFVHTVKTPVKDENGNVVGILGIFWDITEHKKAEETLKESEEKFRSLFENARDIIFTADLKGNITEINRFVEEYGFKRDEVVGKDMLKFVPKKYWPKLLRGVAKLSQGNLVEGEIEIITPKGKIISEYRSNPIRRGKKVVGFQTILRNITERKAMEEKLKQYSEHLEELVQKRTKELLESEKRYSVLVEEASDGVVIVQDGKIVFINRKGAEISYHSKDELIGLPFEQLVDEKYRQFIKEGYALAIQGETVPLTVELEVIAKNGEIVPVEVSIARIYYQGRPALLVIIRDISERKRMEEQHLKLEKLASMGELATMVAHDLRNPLTSIRNASYYIKNSCPARAEPECSTVLEMIDIIEQETLFASNIINELLDFAAKRPLQKNKQNINKIIEGSLTTSKIPENIKVKRNFAEKAIATVDGKQLERVFLNLTNNAVQAIPNGGKLTIATNETKDHIEIEFTDTGAGISKENMSKLFEPLFTTKAKGIGMGLAICKKIVEEHDGTIEVKSKVGQGTTFTIKLPKKEEVNVQ